MKKTLTLLAAVILFASCQEELSFEDEVFRGNWDNDRYALQIYQNGYGICDIRNRGRCEGNVRIRRNKIVFQSDNDRDAVGRKAFRIDQRPRVDADGVTFMILDGRRFNKQW